MFEVLNLNWMAFTIAIALAVILLFILRFESNSNPRKIALLGMLTALTVVSRQLFHAVGEFSPIFFIVTLAGNVYGSSAGFMLGASTMLVSNFLLGQGPWTPYQMFGLGLIGFLAGLLPKKSFRMPILLLYAVLSAYIYGFITDLFWWSAFAAEHSLQTYIAVASAGLLMDTSRAFGNLLFMLLLGKALLKILERFGKRFYIKAIT
jgi:energy-coupling factor transport system substrate-specific component